MFLNNFHISRGATRSPLPAKAQTVERFRDASSDVEVISGQFLTVSELTIIQQLLKCYLPNTSVWAYGSRVNGRVQAASDLVAIVCAERYQNHSKKP